MDDLRDEEEDAVEGIGTELPISLGDEDEEALDDETEDEELGRMGMHVDEEEGAEF